MAASGGAASRTAAPALDRAHRLFARFARLAAEIFHVPLAAVALVDRDHRIYFATTSSGASEAHRAGLPIALTVSENRTLVIPDAYADPLWRTNLGAVTALECPFYAGAPLPCGDRAIGVLCLLGSQPCHGFDAADRKLLESLAILVSDLLAIDQSGPGLSSNSP